MSNVGGGSGSVEVGAAHVRVDAVGVDEAKAKVAEVPLELGKVEAAAKSAAATGAASAAQMTAAMEETNRRGVGGMMRGISMLRASIGRLVWPIMLASGAALFIDKLIHARDEADALRRKLRDIGDESVRSFRDASIAARGGGDELARMTQEAQKAVSAINAEAEAQVTSTAGWWKRRFGLAPSVDEIRAEADAQARAVTDAAMKAAEAFTRARREAQLRELADRAELEAASGDAVAEAQIKRRHAMRDIDEAIARTAHADEIAHLERVREMTDSMHRERMRRAWEEAEARERAERERAEKEAEREADRARREAENAEKAASIAARAYTRAMRSAIESMRQGQIGQFGAESAAYELQRIADRLEVVAKQRALPGYTGGVL